MCDLLDICIYIYTYKVIVITHAYANRKGVRYMDGSLKVYYCVSDVSIINLSCTCTAELKTELFLVLTC